MRSDTRLLFWHWKAPAENPDTLSLRQARPHPGERALIQGRRSTPRTWFESSLDAATLNSHVLPPSSRPGVAGREVMRTASAFMTGELEAMAQARVRK